MFRTKPSGPLFPAASVGVSLFALLLVGCPRRVETVPGPLPGADELLAQVTAAEARISSVKGEARLGVDTPAGKGSVTVFAAAERPARVHLESLDFFGRPQAVLVSDGERFGLYQAQEGRYYRGPASPANLARFLPVPVSPEQLVAMLLGEAPRLPGAEATVAKDGDAYAVTLQAGARTQVLRIDPVTARVVRSEVKGEGGYTLVFEEITATGGADAKGPTFARKVTLTSGRSRLELRYTDVAFNAPAEEGMYGLVPPDNVPVVEVDASGAVAPNR